MDAAAELLDPFDALLVRAAASAAHGELCRRVHGLDLPLYDVLDRPQLEALLGALDLDGADRLLDLGCGLGGVAEYVSRATGCRTVGVDRAAGALLCTRRRTGDGVGGLHLVAADIRSLCFAPASFDAILAVDVLYFLPDLDPVVARLAELLAPGGRMGLFASEVLASAEDGRDRDLDRDLSRHTRLARNLVDRGLEIVRTWDFSANEEALWRRQGRAVRELAAAFAAEGNQELLRLRAQEVERVLEWVEAGRVRRFFYLVRQA